MSVITPRDRAQRGYSLALQRLAEVKATNVAVEMGVTDSTVSKLKTDHLEAAITLLAYLGLKVVDADAKCMSPAAYAFITEAHSRMTAHAPQLIWGDE